MPWGGGGGGGILPLGPNATRIRDRGATLMRKPGRKGRMLWMDKRPEERMEGGIGTKRNRKKMRKN
jgi:hypothetical protein